MLRERRIRKQAQPFAFNGLNALTKKQLLKKKANFIKGTYQAIPCPSKYSFPNNIYTLYGNIILMEKDGTIVVDPSLINTYINYRDIQVTKLSNQKIVTLFTERKKEMIPSDWKLLVDKLHNSQIIECQNLAQAVKSYCEHHELQLQNVVQNEGSLHNDEKNINLTQAAETVEKKKNMLMETYPCLCFTSRLNGLEEDLTEININQKFLSEIGYTTDSFTSIVLQEGLPRLFSLQNETSCDIIKSLLENYLQGELDSFQTQEFNGALLLKCGYVKNVKFQIYVFLQKGLKSYKVDILCAILDKNSPAFQEFVQHHFSPDFLEVMSYKEKEMASFLSMYYHESPTLRYTNMNKICRIQETTFDGSEEEMD